MPIYSENPYPKLSFIFPHSNVIVGLSSGGHHQHHHCHLHYSVAILPHQRHSFVPKPNCNLCFGFLFSHSQFEPMLNYIGAVRFHHFQSTGDTFSNWLFVLYSSSNKFDRNFILSKTAYFARLRHTHPSLDFRTSFPSYPLPLFRFPQLFCLKLCFCVCDSSAQSYEIQENQKKNKNNNNREFIYMSNRQCTVLQYGCKWFSVAIQLFNFRQTENNSFHSNNQETSISRSFQNFPNDIYIWSTHIVHFICTITKTTTIDEPINLLP